MASDVGIENTGEKMTISTEVLFDTFLLIWIVIGLFAIFFVLGWMFMEVLYLIRHRNDEPLEEEETVATGWAGRVEYHPTDQDGRR